MPAARKQPKAVDQHVGSRIRARRLAGKMSQETLADALGITFQQVQKYEKGANRVSSSRLVQIAHALKVPVPYFFDGSGSKVQLGDGAEKAIDEFAATSEGVALVRAFLKVKDPKTRRAIVDLVRLAANDPRPAQRGSGIEV